MHIRLAKGCDLEQIAALEVENPSPWSLAVLEKELQKKNSILLVALENRDEVRCVGWLCASTILPDAELEKIAVHGKHRKQGVGGKLFSALYAKLNQLSCEKIFLEVRADNFSALKFYARHGFLQIGKRVAYYTDPDDDALILQKDVGRGCLSVNRH